jgi:hypothetical protein
MNICMSDGFGATKLEEIQLQMGGNPRENYPAGY